MASVQSLGVHEPTGLDIAIEEEFLPENPPDSSYSWGITPAGCEDEDGEDELLVTETCVFWSQGNIFQKSFSFEDENEPVTRALIAYFPCEEDIINLDEEENDEDAKKGGAHTLSKALVVFLKTEAHIYFLSGTSHIVQMPFEVESACAAPRGVIIQRKKQMDTLAPVSLKFPQVPPNSFVSSQIAGPSLPSSQAAGFSTDGLGNPKQLPLRMTSTLGNMWHPPLETSSSRWPRLVCLTDPLLEVGLVVTRPDKTGRGTRRRSSMRLPFLDPAEEILHIETVRPPHQPKVEHKYDLVLAVTANRETNMYTVWRLEYLEVEDIFISRRKKPKATASRRRSSMPPGLASGAQTPLPPTYRESFGATLPGKKTRKNDKPNDKPEEPLDIAMSLDPDKGEATRRQSRRVSSLLARGDLSASHDRSAFVEPSHTVSHGGGKRVESHGSQRARMSGTFGTNLGSLVEPAVDDLLDELGAFDNMGLDDHDFEGLSREMLFVKIHSVPMDNTNVRYSLSAKPASTQSKVFVLVGPASATDELGRTQVLVGIQDPLDKRLQLLTFHLTKDARSDSRGTDRLASKRTGNTGGSVLTFGQLRRAQSVVDSCKIFDGPLSMILILSEDQTGHRELSLQAPWSALTTVRLPTLVYDNPNSLGYDRKYPKKGVTEQRLVVTDDSKNQITSIFHPRGGGLVDLRTKDGSVHRINIRLRPACPFVRRAVDACTCVLPPVTGEKMLAGWWHIMHWLQEKDDPLASPEWSGFVILLFITFLATSDAERVEEPETPRPVKRSRPNSWETMFEGPNSTICPPWMKTKAWQWMLDEGVFDNPADAYGDKPVEREGFLGQHIKYAKEFMASSSGIAAVGTLGYLPTAANKTADARRSAVGGILLALHLLLEEQKLDIMHSDDVSPGPADLRALLCQVARWLKWREYVSLYELGIQEDPDPKYDSELDLQPPIPEPKSICVFEWIQALFTSDKETRILTLEELFGIVTGHPAKIEERTRAWELVTPRLLMFKRLFEMLPPMSTHVEMVVAMHQCGFTPGILETLPEAVLTPLQDALCRCQAHPPPTWSKELLELVNRNDITMVLKPDELDAEPEPTALPMNHHATWDYKGLCQSVDDFDNVGFDEDERTERQAVVRALFKDDRRLNEAQKLLPTHKSRVVRLDPNPTWTESQYLEKQKELVTTVASSTLAIPAGRGLMYYALRFPLLTEKFNIGGFNLTCVVKPSNVTVGVDKSLFTEEKINWAFFHQGVAGGLAISPEAKGIDTSWILYNKPGQELSNRHAGFLLALGLNGHLKSVAKWVAFKYLTPKHTMTSIGLLLGLAASYLGTMDSLITRLLSVHVTRMLPRGAAELNLSHHTQTTGIMGIGLLYCNSQHRRMSEIMMSEVEHVDDEDEEDPLRNEGYRLAAGFALGLINLGKGTDLKGLHDMRLTEKLLTIATATKRVELVHVLDRSSAGAVVAIALIFMKSEDHIVARKIDVPDSVLQFDYIRPDILLLRTVAKNLILWKKIKPSLMWIKDSLPKEFQWQYQLSMITRLQSKDLPFFSILAGLCFAMALRFAGSGNAKVRDLLVQYLDQFMRIGRLPALGFDAEMARGNARMCTDTLALSAATVMAGTGDLEVLRRLRAMHGRDDPHTTYGSHLAAHLAVGALFLSCGTSTFGTSDLAVAALLIAFYPIFPVNVQDNRSHLQAFRHFWVLATEPRCLVTKDVATGQPISVPVEIYLKEPSTAVPSRAASDKDGKDTNRSHSTSKLPGEDYTDTTGTYLRRTTPCLLPPLDEIIRLRTDAAAEGFWNLELDFQKDEAGLAAAFRRSQSLFLRRRPAGEGTFAATLRALGSADVSETGSASIGTGNPPDTEGGAGVESARVAVATAATPTGAARGGSPPGEKKREGDALEWVFSLRAFAGLTHAERALVLDVDGNAAGVGDSETATTAVDARLVLEAGVDGWDRSRLLGLKLLFEWADRRRLGIRAGVDTAGVEDGGADFDNENLSNDMEVGDDMGIGDEAATSSSKGRGRGKEMADLGMSDEDGDGDQNTEQTSSGLQADNEEAGWWLRDSVIEMLKGKAWLASRD